MIRHGPKTVRTEVVRLHSYCGCKDPSNQTPNHFQTPIFFANEDNGCAHLVSVDFFCVLAYVFANRLYNCLDLGFLF